MLSSVRTSSTACDPFPVDLGLPASTVPHALHAGQRPNHRGAEWPHAPHSNSVAVFIGSRLATTYDRFPRGGGDERQIGSAAIGVSSVKPTHPLLTM